MTLLPQDFSLIIPKHTPISTELACKIIPALLDEDHPFKLKIVYQSGVMGKTEDQWVELRAVNAKGSYTVCFSVRKGVIITLLAIISPTGSSWVLSDEAQNPSQYITMEQKQALTTMLVPQKNVFTLRPLFRLEVDGRPVSKAMDLGYSPSRLSFPKELDRGPILEDEEMAKRALKLLELYWKDCLTREPKKKK